MASIYGLDAVEEAKTNYTVWHEVSNVIEILNVYLFIYLFIYLFTDFPLKTYKTSRFDITKEQRRLGWKCHTEISSPITGFQITHTRHTNTPHTNYYTYKLHIQVTQTLNKRSNIQR